MAFPRAAGLLLHPTSLPGGHGIGDLGDSAYRFVDLLTAAGMGVWQVLPLGPTGAANSPYQALSSFAGNPLLISLEGLANEGVLQIKDLKETRPSSSKVDYDRARADKEARLRQAFANLRAGQGKKGFRSGFTVFRDAVAEWLDDFALFMACKEHFKGVAWYAWPDRDLRQHKADAVAKASKELDTEVAFHAFCQYAFFSQWRALKTYANDRGVHLMGDVPIYVAHDSADVWADPQYFALDASGRAAKVAGVPPDYFSATGQLWGNPLYRWQQLQDKDYAWWIRRIRATLELVDRLRIDHFRGFEAYWEVDGTEETAINGRWVKGPGRDFFEALESALGHLPIVAEDLGIITPEVNALRQAFGLPGMKVLQFAFCDGAEMYLPFSHERNCVVYTATHDNDTTVGWYRAQGPDYAHMDRDTLARERDKARRYLACGGSAIHMDFIRLAMQSVADTAIIPVQDVLGLDNEARMNRPGITDGQWGWRLTPAQLAAAPVDQLREMVWLYGREPGRQAAPA